MKSVYFGFICLLFASCGCANVSSLVGTWAYKDIYISLDKNMDSSVGLIDSGKLKIRVLAVGRWERDAKADVLRLNITKTYFDKISTGTVRLKYRLLDDLHCEMIDETDETTGNNKLLRGDGVLAGNKALFVKETRSLETVQDPVWEPGRP
jgi:hypothetical protein